MKNKNNIKIYLNVKRIIKCPIVKEDLRSFNHTLGPWKKRNENIEC